MCFTRCKRKEDVVSHPLFQKIEYIQLFEYLLSRDDAAVGEAGHNDGQAIG